jgi:hypothetical protein
MVCHLRINTREKNKAERGKRKPQGCSKRAGKMKGRDWVFHQA